MGIITCNKKIDRYECILQRSYLLDFSKYAELNDIVLSLKLIHSH